MAYELLWVLLDLLGNTLPWLIPEKTRLERNLNRLKKERWFSRLYGRDFENHMEKSPELRKFLKKRRNVRILLKNPYEREHFIREIEAVVEVPKTTTK